MGTNVALLRGINVGGHRRVPMAQLRGVAEEIGLARPRTLIASGNLVFESEVAPEELERRIESAIAERFGFPVDVIVRTDEQWRAYVAANPFPEEGAADPAKLMMVIGKAPAGEREAAALLPYASGDERVASAGDALWLWFAQGAGRSRLGAAPAGSGIWTARNWNTVLRLREMVA